MVFCLMVDSVSGLQHTGFPSHPKVEHSYETFRKAKWHKAKKQFITLGDILPTDAQNKQREHRCAQTQFKDTAA